MAAKGPQDVDEIWAEMQQESRARPAGQTRKEIRKISDISSLQRTRTSAKRPVAKKLDASLQWMEKWAVPLKLQAEVDFQLGPGEGTATAIFSELAGPPTTFIDALEDIPTETPETFLAYLQRDINCLSEESLAVRLQSLQKLGRVLVDKADSLPTDIFDAVGEVLLKPVLKRMKDKSEKCREIAVRILRSLVENTSDLTPMLGYLFPTLVARLGCEDLDGVAHLPEVMRPDKEQKPVELARPVEESEEVRLQLAQFVAALLRRCSPSQIYSYVDEATGLLRAQAMDPFHEVKVYACETMITFCYNHAEMLLHFAEPLGRSLMSCLTHPHCKVRIVGLRAITAVFWCGVWKHNHEIVQQLMAWQDPNKASIKAFYEPVTSINYMSTLTFDRHPAVRRFWFETMAYWLLRVPDKVDHEPYIFPYLLAGLCDDNEDIALEVFWLIERCGELYEGEHETDLRKTKQYGFDYGWTYGGRGFAPFPLQAIWGGGGKVDHFRRAAAAGPDFMGEKALEEHEVRDKMEPYGAEANLGDLVPLPDRDYCWHDLRDLAIYRRLPRPRLGSRCWVRTHTRRYIKATFNDVVDFRDCTALNAGRLLCMSLAYTEEGVTEWLQPMFQALIKFYAGRAWAASAGDPRVTETYNCVCKLLGAFLDPASAWQQLKDAMDNDAPLDLDQRIAGVRILALCIEGSVAVLQSVQPPDPELGMGRLAPVIPELISALHASDLLLSPTEESRAALWALLLSFAEPLRPHLTFGQVSQLLFISLALAAKPPADAVVELAQAQVPSDGPSFDEEEIVDADKLERILTTLGSGLEGAAQVAASGSASAAFSLDSLDDDDAGGDGGSAGAPLSAEAAAEADVRAVHHVLFQRAFPEVLAHVDDSFQVFRSILYLTPLALLTSREHAATIVSRLQAFCGGRSSSTTRTAAQALAVHVALRCMKALHRQLPGGRGDEVAHFIGSLFQMIGRAQLEGLKSAKHLSYMVIVSCLSMWRRFFLHPLVDPRWALFPASGEASASLEWMTSLLADQEMYKRFHASLEYAETSTTGRDKDGFVVRKAKQLRDEADHRASVVRVLSISTVLLVLRRMFADGQPVPWSSRTAAAGSAAALFTGVASILRPATPTLEPLFIKPTPSYMTLYAAELLRLLLRSVPAAAAREPFRLLDDAARAIHHLSAPLSPAELPLVLTPEEREALASDFIAALVDLNLSLPPDPNAKHAPASLDGAGSGDIALGWEKELLPEGASAAAPSSSAVPAEVSRVLAQSAECLGWNAALSMYSLGLDLSVVCRDGFQQAIARWRRRKEQAKVLIAADVLDRARKLLS